MTASPREVEAQLLLRAAKQLYDVCAGWNGPEKAMWDALLYNRRLWLILMSAAESNSNPQPLEMRQNIINVGAFVIKQMAEMQIKPDPARLQPLIDINRNLAAGLS